MGGVCALGLSSAKKSTSLTNQLAGQKSLICAHRVGGCHSLLSAALSGLLVPYYHLRDVFRV